MIFFRYRRDSARCLDNPRSNNQQRIVHKSYIPFVSGSGEDDLFGGETIWNSFASRTIHPQLRMTSSVAVKS